MDTFIHIWKKIKASGDKLLFKLCQVFKEYTYLPYKDTS